MFPKEHMRIERSDERLVLVCESTGERSLMEMLITELDVGAECDRITDPHGWIMSASTYSAILRLYESYAQTASLGSNPKKARYSKPAAHHAATQLAAATTTTDKPFRVTQTVATAATQTTPPPQQHGQTQTPIRITTHSYPEKEKRPITSGANSAPTSHPHVQPPPEVSHHQPPPEPLPEVSHHQPPPPPSSHVQPPLQASAPTESTGSTYSGYDTLPNMRLGLL